MLGAWPNNDPCSGVDTIVYDKASPLGSTPSKVISTDPSSSTVTVWYWATGWLQELLSPAHTSHSS